MEKHVIYSILSFIVAFVLLATLSYVLIARRSQGLPETWITAGDTKIRAEIAASPLARARGLSYRDELPEGRGMLFTFGRAQRHAFWMKGMRFPIDIVWIKDSVVVDVTPDVPPASSSSMLDIKTYLPLVPADDVLELPAGYAAAHNIVPGTRITLGDE